MYKKNAAAGPHAKKSLREKLLVASVLALEQRKNANKEAKAKRVRNGNKDK